MNKEQVYNILSKRAAQQVYAPVQQARQADPIKQFQRRVLGPSVMDYKNGADIQRLHQQERRKKLQKLINSIMPQRKPAPAANNSLHVKNACLQWLMKTASIDMDAQDKEFFNGDSSDYLPALKDKVQALDPRQQIDKYFKNPVPWFDHVTKSYPVQAPAGNAASPSTEDKNKNSKEQSKTEGQAKTPQKPGTPDPWSRWGGKLIGGGLGGLGLYGIMSIFTNSPILRALAFLFGAGAGGYMGHTYDAYKASRVPSSKVPGNKPTT